MKKITLGLLILLVLITGAIYLLVPNKLIISTKRIIAGNSNAAYRNLISVPGNWEHWMDTATGKLSYKSGNTTFTTIGMYTNYNELIIKNNPGDSFKTQLEFFPVTKDSFLVQWQTETITGYNPVKKIQQYFTLTKVLPLMDLALNRFESFIQNDTKVYSAPVKNMTVVDTLLIATYLETDTIPGKENIYHLIQELQQTIAAQHGTIQDSGMMHIAKMAPDHYKTMVAVPIQHVIKPAPNQVIKRLVEGNILVMEKTGGPYTILHAQDMLQTFVTDHSFISPAIPFQKLITNRLTEADTTKWITRFYYPVY